MPVRTLPPAELVTQGNYDLRGLSSPVLTGWALRAFTLLAETPLINLLYPKLARDSGIPQAVGVETCIPDMPRFTGTPTDVTPGDEPFSQALDADSATSRLQQAVGVIATALPSSAKRVPTVMDYYKAYKQGLSTPTQVAQRIIDFLTACGQPWLIAWSAPDILQQAAASTARYRDGCPLSELDGVPFAVKDSVDALPYQTTAGTTFLADRRPVTADAPAVAALKQLGAVLLGKAAMHEIGLGTLGVNAQQGVCRNPHGPRHVCGGSSTGSAALVAAGVCPIAIGGDGGGSIRVPASLCGCVGLKPTNGRVSGKHSVSVDYSVATAGPMAGCVEDLLLLYTLMANLDTAAAGQGGPPPARLPTSLPAAASSGSSDVQLPLKGLRCGVYWKWFQDADPEVVATCTSAVRLLEQQGAQVVDICIPELELLRVAHTVTISSEMYNNFKALYEKRSSRRAFGKDVRVSLTLAKRFSSAEYMQAQAIRKRGWVHFNRAFQQADVLITPTTPCTAPPLPAEATSAGIMNLGLTSKLMRYAFPANMLGLPAISVPVGQDSEALPIGLQIMGRPWQDATLVRLAAVLESAVAAAASTSPAAAPHTLPTPAFSVNPLLPNA